MREFSNLGISRPILQSIQEENFERPTEIQQKSIPHVLDGNDVIAGAATGSGKTLAFATGVIKRTDEGEGIQAIILTPTRELARQVAEEIETFSKHKRLKVVQIYGGVAFGPQIEGMNTCEIVVGTPGRVLDHIRRGNLDLSRARTVVLDEADRMLEMGFREDVERIVSNCPKERQTLLFSATITNEVRALSNKYTVAPIEIAAESYVDPDKLEQVYYDVPHNLKLSLLVHLLKEERGGLVMVFCNTRRGVDFVVHNLEREGIEATAIHGGFSQDKREKTMDRFDEGKARVLVCTDVASRGLDIGGVSHIYNYDIPSHSKDYVHRIGRTARAGESGKVVNLLCKRDHDNFRQVNEDHFFDIESVKRPYVKMVKARSPPRRRRGRRRR